MEKECKYTNGEISEFCRSLALLFHAGIGLGDGLFLLAEDACGEKTVMFEEMGRKADEGIVLSRIIEESDRFPVYVVGMVKVGENTGRMEEALLALAGYYEEQDRMNRQLKNTLAYPALLMCMIVIVIGVLLVKVLPVFDEVYGTLGGSLTGVAGGLLVMGRFLQTAMPVLCALLMLAIVGVLVFVQKASVRRSMIRWWQRRYGDRGVSRMLNDAHFAQALAMGLKSGLPLDEAVRLASDVLKDIPEAKHRCDSCVDGLMGGESLTDVLKRSAILPASACRMLELGVRGGNGDAVMEEIAERLSEEARVALERRMALVEPVMVMAASALVGFVLLAVMLPLMHIMSAIG